MEQIFRTNKFVSRFIMNINNVYKKTTGYETYGDTTEFYDESGCVLMTATENGPGKVQFKISGDEEMYDYTGDESN